MKVTRDAWLWINSNFWQMVEEKKENMDDNQNSNKNQNKKYKGW